MAVTIRGDGVAGRCCASLLARAGISVCIESVARPRVPAIMLGESAQRLIEDVFGPSRAFEKSPRIRKRIVAWGDREPVAIEHSAVVISEEALLETIGAAGAAKPGCRNSDAEPAYTVWATKPLPAESAEHAFGSRTATATPVTLAPAAEPDACWMESLDEGWLFLVTTAPGRGWLISAASDPQSLLARSRLLQSIVIGAGEPSARFPCAPRIVAPLGGPRWLACGSAAMAFDPICGDGTAHAIREAILASAVIRAALRGEDAAPLVAHYENRLTAAFLKHLTHCVEFYAPLPASWWREETRAAREGIEWCGRRLGDRVTFAYRLNGFELERTA